MENSLRVCTTCVMDTTDSAIHFDREGVCDYCIGYHSRIKPEWDKIHKNKDALDALSNKIKEAGKGQKYDCIIGMSGGVDSSYLCYVAKEIMGLRPLIYTVDTGWNMNVANKNIERIVKALDLDIVTDVVDWNEMRDLQLAFLKAQVPYQDLPQDHAIFASLYNYSVKQGIKYVLTGSNTATESIRPPIEWVYFNDIRFIQDVHKRFGKVQLKTFPLCGMFKYRLYYAYLKKMTRVAPLDYLEFDKKGVEHFLNERFGWEAYENKHYENIFTRWYEGYYLTEKFGYDKRKCYYSNLILAGQMTHDQALEMLKSPGYSAEETIGDTAYIAEKLEISTDELQALVMGEKKSYKDYKNAYGLISTAIKLASIVGVESRNFR